MIPRLFAKITLENRPERVAPLREVMEQNTARGVVGALAGDGQPARSPRRTGRDPRADARPRRRGGRGHAAGRGPGHGRRDPGARLEVIPEAGHLAPYENHAVANGVILRFLEELTDSAEALSAARADAGSPVRATSRLAPEPTGTLRPRGMIRDRWPPPRANR